MYTRQRLAIYTSVASKNASVQQVKTPVKTPLLGKFLENFTLHLGKAVENLWNFKINFVNVFK